MFDYKVMCIDVFAGDSCLKVMVGDFEVSVAFSNECPSDIRIYDRQDEQNKDVTKTVYGEEYVTASSFADITEAIELVEKKFYLPKRR